MAAVLCVGHGDVAFLRDSSPFRLSLCLHLVPTPRGHLGAALHLPGGCVCASENESEQKLLHTHTTTITAHSLIARDP